MAISDLMIVKKAFIEEQQFLDKRGPDYIPNLSRVAKRIERLEKRRDAIHEAEMTDLAEVLNPNA